MFGTTTHEFPMRLAVKGEACALAPIVNPVNSGRVGWKNSLSDDPGKGHSPHSPPPSAGTATVAAPGEGRAPRAMVAEVVNLASSQGTSGEKPKEIGHLESGRKSQRSDVPSHGSEGLGSTWGKTTQCEGVARVCVCWVPELLGDGFLTAFQHCGRTPPFPRLSWLGTSLSMVAERSEPEPISLSLRSSDRETRTTTPLQ